METELIMRKLRKPGQDWSKQENAIKGTEKQTLVKSINLFHKREETTVRIGNTYPDSPL